MYCLIPLGPRGLTIPNDSTQQLPVLSVVSQHSALTDAGRVLSALLVLSVAVQHYTDAGCFLLALLVRAISSAHLILAGVSQHYWLLSFSNN